MKYFDVHSHILPGLDDGAGNMQQALEMLRIACDEGIGTIIATPHNMPGKGCPSGRLVMERMELLRKAAKEEGLSIRLLGGTEYFYRQEVLELMDDDNVIPLGDTACVLVEFDPGAEYGYIRSAVCEILDRGYIPVIAHAERYVRLMQRGYKGIEELKVMGALIQINCGSVMGRFGSKAKRDTQKLLKKKLVDLLGTDAHSSGNRSPRMKECAELLYRRYEKNYAEALLGARALELSRR